MVTAYGDANGVTGWKYRKGGWLPTSPPKETWWSPGSKRSLFGIHLWDGEPTDVYLCEGETDAMCLSQAVSGLCLAFGGNPSDELLDEWLDVIRNVLGDTGMLTLAFDNDSEGERYTRRVSKRYRNRHVALDFAPHKDACEWLAANEVPLFKWHELPRLPKSVRRMTDITSELRSDPEPIPTGITCGIAQLDFLTGGYAPGSFWMLAAPTKQGKSAFAVDLTVKYVMAHQQRVLFIPLELTDTETTLLMGADVAGVPLYGANPSDVLGGCDAVAEYVYVAKHFGYLTIEELDEYFDVAETLDVGLVVIDHITAAATHSVEGLQTQQLDAMLYRIKAHLNRLGISCLCVTHVNGAETDLVTPETLRGSRALGQVPTAVLGIQRFPDDMARIYSITAARMTGRRGIVELEFRNGKYTSIGELEGKLL